LKIAKPVRILLSSGAVLAVLAGGFAVGPAEARTFVSVGVGLPLAFPVYAPPPPVVYAPPAYAPPVAYVPPAPVAYSRTTCREFQKTIVIDGQQQNGFGVACLQPDGTWRVAP
jgi:hypothetical protein